MDRVVLSGTSDILNKLVDKYGDITILECIVKEETENSLKGGKSGYMQPMRRLDG